MYTNRLRQLKHLRVVELVFLSLQNIWEDVLAIGIYERFRMRNGRMGLEIRINASIVSIC